MKTKQDLLNRMKLCGACWRATEWVESFADGTPAREIWLACDRVDWMCWFAFRGRPKAGMRFSCAAADIAIHVYAVAVLRRVGLHDDADRLAALPTISPENAARAAAAYAAYAAHDAARAAAAYAAYAAHDAAAAAYAAARAAARAAEAASTDVAYATSERERQIKALHALWDGKHGLEGRV